MRKYMLPPFMVITKPIGPRCNLDCQYCFYLRKEALFDEPVTIMDDKLLENWISSYITLHAHLPMIHFIWQGGEPTLCGLDFFKKVIHYQRKYAPDNVTIINALQTNGILITEPWAAFLKEHNFLVGVSIDGPEDLHDQYRKDKRQKGTYKLAVKGLKNLQKYQVEINSLTVVNATNGKKPKEVYNHLVDLGFTYIQFIPCVEPILSSQKTANVTAWSVKPKQWGNFLNIVFDTWYQQNHMHKIGVQLFDIQMNLHRNIPPSLCIFAPSCGDALALEHNGDLYACDHFVEDAYYLGNINENTLSRLAHCEKQRAFGDMKYKQLPKPCHQCQWLKRCWGECPKNRFVPNKNNPPKAYLCKGWKQFFQYTDPYFHFIAYQRNICVLNYLK